MSVHERTYSFRADDDLAERTREAFATWSALLEGSSEQLWFTFVKNYALAANDIGDSHSARLRAIAEIFVRTAESVAEGQAYIDEYREWAREDEEGTLWRRGALDAAAGRWRDG